MTYQEDLELDGAVATCLCLVPSRLTMSCESPLKGLEHQHRAD